jgi:hypothetical protein
VQCTDDSNGARPCIDPLGEGRLLWELQDDLVFGPAAVRSLRIGEDRPNGALNPRAVGPMPSSSPRVSRVAIRAHRSPIS